MELRQLKGMELAARTRISCDGHGFTVPSQSGSGPYRVTLRPAESCAREDFQLRQLPCKHVFATRFVQEREFGGHAQAVAADRLPKKPTHRQDWPAYNLAQAVEKRRFQTLLCELYRGVPEPPHPRTGRRPSAAKDALFAMGVATHSGGLRERCGGGQWRLPPETGGELANWRRFSPRTLTCAQRRPPAPRPRGAASQNRLANWRTRRPPPPLPNRLPHPSAWP